MNTAMSVSSEGHGLSLAALTLALIVSSGNERFLPHPEANVKRMTHRTPHSQNPVCLIFRTGESWHGFGKTGEGIIMSFDRTIAVQRPIKTLLPDQRQCARYWN